MKDRAEMRKGAQQIIAQIGQVYIDILGGMRGPEQLSRWLSEDTYLQVCNEHSLQHRIRKRTDWQTSASFLMLPRQKFSRARKTALRQLS